jgi:proteasome accessory factor B/proteasome accessory factor C
VAQAKLQRWIDLLAALLRRHGHVTLEELCERVPAYARSRGSKQALRRTFERDKKELRDYGVPIETVKDAGSGEVLGYRLRTKDFYLPYLALMVEGRPVAKAKRVDRDGYRSLPELAFEPDELEAIVAAGRRVEQLGSAALAEQARSALRKLAADLPVGAAETHEAIVPPKAKVDDAVFDELAGALETGKRVTITYHSMGRNAVEERDVEPYGLFFLGQHWYLAARDYQPSSHPAAQPPVKNFRVSRIQAAAMNGKRPGQRDFEVPAGWSLKEHAKSRNAWELGDGDVVEAIVEFTGKSGHARAAAKLGEPVDGQPTYRRFKIRRLEPFTRWLLSLAGDAHPVEPQEVVDAWRQLARDVLALYEVADER